MEVSLKNNKVGHGEANSRLRIAVLETVDLGPMKQGAFLGALTSVTTCFESFDLSYDPLAVGVQISAVWLWLSSVVR